MDNDNNNDITSNINSNIVMITVRDNPSQVNEGWRESKCFLNPSQTSLRGDLQPRQDRICKRKMDAELRSAICSERDESN